MEPSVLSLQSHSWSGLGEHAVMASRKWKGAFCAQIAAISKELGGNDTLQPKLQLRAGYGEKEEKDVLETALLQKVQSRQCRLYGGLVYSAK